MATYGSFPGVRVVTQSGGISSIAIGEEEKLVLFGEANYVLDTSGSSDELVVEGDDTSLSISANSPEQINARREANAKFGDGSELAEGMKESLANGANIDFLYGVAVGRDFVEAETQTSQTGTLDNFPIVENTGASVDSGGDSIGDQGVTVTDTGDGAVSVEFRYGDGSGNAQPNSPSDGDTVFINPLTGEYSADAAPDGDYEFDYTYNQYSAAFGASDVRNVVNEDETGIYVALSDSDSVSSSLQGEVSTLRDNYQLVNGISVAEPNANEVLDAANVTNANGGANARYNTSQYANANQSVSAEFYYKFAPGREEDAVKTIAGGVGGLFAGNPISDPIYNDQLSGYQSLEQQLSKTDADNLRGEDVIPVRSGGAIRVVGNRSTNFSASSTVAADFWTRRITDRVILIGKQVGDEILGRINDETTRSQAERLINAEMQSLVSDRLIRANTDNETNWAVDVYEDSTNNDQVNIDISFSPYGIVKQVDETITVNTN
jgi:hypothetical protein